MIIILELAKEIVIHPRNRTPRMNKDVKKSSSSSSYDSSNSESNNSSSDEYSTASSSSSSDIDEKKNILKNSYKNEHGLIISERSRRYSLRRRSK